jgi:hypothetical protein
MLWEMMLASRMQWSSMANPFVVQASSPTKAIRPAVNIMLARRSLFAVVFQSFQLDTLPEQTQSLEPFSTPIQL